MAFDICADTCTLSVPIFLFILDRSVEWYVNDRNAVRKVVTGTAEQFLD